MVSQSERILAAAVGGALILAIAAVWILLAPSDADDPASLLIASPGMPGATPAAERLEAGRSPSPAAPSMIVVDVEGGVARPGIQRLPAGARIADAIAAAGGYGPQVDLRAAASQLNLAQPLSDGEQVYVPLIGDAAAAGSPDDPAQPGASSGGAAAGGPVNLNTATPEELDSLPGIGPVTVQKIVAARQETPFSSLEEAVERGVMNRGQLEDIRDLATAG
ncbi:MAG: ComEA family DNA-binding protein [Candidatus Limnocylindria bacterium]